MVGGGGVRRCRGNVGDAPVIRRENGVLRGKDQTRSRAARASRLKGKSGRAQGSRLLLTIFNGTSDLSLRLSLYVCVSINMDIYL